MSRSDSLTVKVAVTNAVSLTPSQVGGGSVIFGTVTLTGPAPAGDLIVQLSSSKTTVATVSANVTVASGQNSAVFTIATFAVATSQSVTISATVNGIKKSAFLTVVPIALSAIAVDQSMVRVGDLVSVTVSLNGPAATNGFTVTLSSSDVSVISLPPTMTVPAGTTSMTNTTGVNGVGSATLTSTANGVSQSVVLTSGP